ncbi:AbrB/MazE/SpoVT family DNA-binding domain-containing protein [Aliagarivorans taiwanensis]|uniref:AbrB/MazE/SpoVT family DNA-binding domain-containing protein n=1 Tax=Aliagarivorans taiwanensis TaxID=561966 RepID=UPI0004207A4B|nr:AbrB/MazE/SpoVT family DNA-binding domain-containing protein [Aliagarivorans taiwanensis]
MRVIIQENEDGEPFFEIPEEYLKELGWKEGDEVVWTHNPDGSLSLSKPGENKAQ